MIRQGLPGHRSWLSSSGAKPIASVLRVIGSGDEAASEVEVAHGTMGLFRAASFWTVRDGQVASGTEYWLSPGSEEGMPQRAAYVEPM